MAIFVPQDPNFETRVRASFAHLALMRTMAARLLKVTPGELEIDLPFRDDLTQHHGFLAAAVVTAIADVACGYAAIGLMPPDADGLTVEYKVNFVAPAQGERIVARARVVKPGRTITTCAANVFAVTEDQEKLVATMLATIIQIGGERGEASAGESGRRVEGHLAARRHGPRLPRRWCVCDKRGFRQGLRTLVGFGGRGR